MSKFTTIAKIALATATAALSLQAAPAVANRSNDSYDRRVMIVNHTGQTITKVRGTPTSYRNYGPDLIPNNVIGVDEQLRVNFDVGNRACHYDLQVELADGNRISRSDVNVCEESVWEVEEE